MAQGQGREQDAHYLLAEADLNRDFSEAGGTAMLGAGLAIVIHSYWHMWDPMMLGVGGGLAVVGLILNSNARSKRKEQLYMLRHGRLQTT